MSCPRLEIRLDRLHHNAALLVSRLSDRGIAVTGVTKATLGSPEVARTLLDAGVAGLGESRVENIERLRAAGITAPVTLIRSPMISQVARVVAHADTSMNTELVVLEALSTEAERQHRRHGVILMVELGDLREGLLPQDLPPLLAAAGQLPGLELRGIGTNLACQHGIAPDDDNMAILSAVADDHEARTGQALAIVSGGNSATYEWAIATAEPGRVNELRLGEAILLGREPLQRRPIEGLDHDAITLVAEVIERSTKPAAPWGTAEQTAFGRQARPIGANRTCDRAILALGRQDVDPDGLAPPAGVTILGTSSDHLVVGIDPTTPGPPVGGELRFGIDYSALLRAMSSPFVDRSFLEVPSGIDDRATRDAVRRSPPHPTDAPT